MKHRLYSIHQLLLWSLRHTNKLYNQHILPFTALDSHILALGFYLSALAHWAGTRVSEFIFHSSSQLPVQYASDAGKVCSNDIVIVSARFVHADTIPEFFNKSRT